MWFVNFFIDIANVIVVAIPMICYLGAGCFTVLAILAFARLRNPAQAARHDPIKAGLYFFAAVLLASFPSYASAWSGTFGMTTRASAGGQLFTYRTDLPTFTGATPQAWIIGMVEMFMPFFIAFGSAMILRAIFLMKEGWKEGSNVTWPCLIHSVAGVILVNLNTVVEMIMGQAV